MPETDNASDVATLASLLLLVNLSVAPSMWMGSESPLDSWLTPGLQAPLGNATSLAVVATNPTAALDFQLESPHFVPDALEEFVSRNFVRVNRWT